MALSALHQRLPQRRTASVRRLSPRDLRRGGPVKRLNSVYRTIVRLKVANLPNISCFTLGCYNKHMFIIEEKVFKRAR
jgi:hypothetical protein